MDLEAEPTDIVAALLLSRVVRVAAGGKVRGEDAERLRRAYIRVDVDPLRGPLLRFPHDRHVAVVRHREELEAPPITRRRSRGRAIVVGVLDRSAEGIDARGHRVVGERREHDRVAGLADHLHRAADPIVDVEAVAGGSESRVRAE